MSRCELSLLFDRTDRVYRGGEKVRGVLRVLVREETKGRGIRLKHRWRTHGRGNTQSGPEELIDLAGPQVLMAGEQLEFPFEVTAPTHPITYHGHLISIDHYIQAEVDVAWATNPVIEEEYILRPGRIPPQLSGGRDTIVSLKAEATPGKTGLVGTILLTLLALVVLAILAAFAFFLIPVFAAVAIFLWIRSKAVASRVGDVEVLMPHKIAAPGEQWPVTVKFTARKAFPVNGVSVQIQGQEIAVSGSGSNRKTHTHVLFTMKQHLRESGLMAAGERLDETIQLPFPATNAFTFEESDNRIKWTAEIRIDIPRFPDWSKEEELLVVPEEFVVENAQLTVSSDVPFSVPKTSAGSSDELPHMLSDSQAPSDAMMPEYAVAASMEELVRQLSSVDRHSPERAQLMAGVTGEVFDVSVIVDRISSSIGALQPGPGYADGRTVVGTIEGTQQTIEILTHDDASAELQGYRRGDLWQSTVEVEGWDTLYSRIRARQIME